MRGPRIGRGFDLRWAGSVREKTKGKTKTNGKDKGKTNGSGRGRPLHTGNVNLWK